MEKKSFEGIAKAYADLKEAQLGSLVPSGIKLKATYQGKPTSSGIQFDNTRMEIMAVPGVEVEVVGYSAMYEVLKALQEHMTMPKGGSGRPYLADVGRMAAKALALVERK